MQAYLTGESVLCNWPQNFGSTIEYRLKAYLGLLVDQGVILHNASIWNDAKNNFILRASKLNELKCEIIPADPLRVKITDEVSSYKDAMEESFNENQERERTIRNKNIEQPR